MTRACRWILFGACLALDVWLSSQLAPAVDDVRLAFWGAVFSIIGAALGWVADKAATIAVVMWHVALFVGKALWLLAIKLADVFRSTYGFLQKFWSNVLRPFVQWAWREIRDLYRLFRRVLDPVLKFLHRVQRDILKIYDKWLRPVFDTITVARRTLQILATLRIEWARELDKKLAELEERLLAPIQFALRHVNELIHWVNRIITLDGLIQRVTLIASLIRYQRDALNVWWSSIHRPLAGEKLAEYEQPLAARPIPAVAQEFRSYVIDHAGPDVERIDEHARDLEIRLRGT